MSSTHRVARPGAAGDGSAGGALRPGARPSTSVKRARIIEVAMQYFAELGYEGARVEDMASELGISKASVFQHFRSKHNLFMEAYKAAARSMHAYLDVPDDLKEAGFFAILRWWLEQTERHAREDWIPWQVMLVGNYGTDLALRTEIGRFIIARDPWGTLDFVRRGIERGEVRDDLDPLLIASSLDWMVERFQDVLMNEELHPLLFGRPLGPSRRTRARIDHFMRLMESAFRRRAA